MYTHHKVNSENITAVLEIEKMLREVFNAEKPIVKQYDNLIYKIIPDQWCYSSNNKTIDLYLNIPLKNEKDFLSDIKNLAKNIDKPDLLKFRNGVSIKVDDLKYLHDNKIKFDIAKIIQNNIPCELELDEKLNAALGISDSYLPTNYNNNRIVSDFRFMQPKSSKENPWENFGKSHELATKLLTDLLTKFNKKHNLANSVRYEFGCVSGHIDHEWFNLVIEKNSKHSLEEIVDIIIKNNIQFRKIIEKTILSLETNQLNSLILSSDISFKKLRLDLNDLSILAKLEGNQIQNTRDNPKIQQGLDMNRLDEISSKYKNAGEWLDKIVDVYNSEKKPKQKEVLGRLLETIKERVPVLSDYIERTMMPEKQQLRA